MNGDKVQRRTQQERTAAARENLIRATQESLTEVGFARTTVSEICKRAGVSSGALIHHFPNKNVVIVAAYIARQAQLLAEAATAEESRRSIGEEVTNLRRKMEDTFPLSYEFFWALRTDDELREELQRQLRQHEIQFSRDFTFSASEIGAASSPLLTRSMITCFLRGLMLEALISDQQSVDEICRHFVEMLTSFVRIGKAA